MEPHNKAALKEIDNYRSALHRLCVLGNGNQDTRRRQRAGL
jgi:hypothetical protein